MNLRFALVLLAGVAVMAGWSFAAPRAAVDCPRRIPVAYDVDVVVVGGSTHAVAAATAAANKGARVFLAAGRTYLGEDLCGTLRLWLEPGQTPETPLGKELFSPKLPQAAPVPKGVAFQYKTDRKSASMHPDARPPSRLHDGRHHDAPSESVQYGGDVTITADLGRQRPLKAVHVLAYQRKADFEVKEVAVAISTDNKTWESVGTAPNKLLARGGFESHCIDLALPVTKPARYVRLAVKKTDRVTRVLLGEVVIETSDEPAPEKPAPKAPTPTITTPMHVKSTLDDALLKAGVTFLYGCFPTDVLRDADGKVAGIVMANRAGRQAVLAKVVIDASDRATVARLAGARFTAFPAGKHTFRQVVLGGKVRDGSGMTARKVGSSYGVVARSRDGKVGRPTGAAAEIIEYTHTIDMPDATFASFAAADQLARDRTFDAGQLRVCEDLFQVPPDAVKSTGALTGDWGGSDAADLRALQPAGVEGLYVLGGCADVPRAVAEKLLKPTGLIRLGERVGVAAATGAAKRPKLKGVNLPAVPADDPVGGEVREFLTGVRATQKLPTVPAGARALPVLGRYDVVVIGGGTGGAPAGIAAGRHGARTLVVEYLHGLGGVGTQGLIGNYYHGYRGGFTAEVDQGVATISGLRRSRGGWNVEAKMHYWRREIRKAKGDVWFGAIGCGALVEAGSVRGAVVATPAGRGVVLADVVIDGTGNADIAAAAGAPFIHTDGQFLAVQGTGLPPRALGASYTNTDYTFVDDSDMIDVWRLFVSARRKYRGAFDLGQLIDTRERRRIRGEVVLTILDQMNERMFPDVIGMCKSDFDMHGYPVHPFFVLHHPQRKSLTTYVPYRCLLPAKLDGMLVIGLGISVHRDALPGTRMQPDIQNIGYAAGTAAAMAAKSGGTTREIDLVALQKHLAEIGNIPAKAVGAKDSYPMPAEKVAQAVRSLASGHDGMAIVLAHKDQALSLLREALNDAKDPKVRQSYAQVLAVCGDDSGVEVLRAFVRQAKAWDRGWNFKGMGQYGWALSPIDRAIVALGMARDKQAVDLIVEKVKLLTPASEFSHHRAVSLALEMLGDASAGEALGELLARDGMTGHAMGEPAPGSDRSLCLREIIVARALYRLGDHKNLGRKSLTAYTRDVRGHFARHANAILQAGGK